MAIGNIRGSIFGLSDVYAKQIQDSDTDIYWPAQEQYAWWTAGGVFNIFGFGAVSSSRRLEYSTDTLTPIGNSPLARASTGTVSSNKLKYAWWFDGQTGITGASSITSRLDLASESWSVQGNTPSASLVSVGIDFDNYGFGFGKLFLNTAYSSAYKLDYGTETWSTASNPFGAARGATGTTSNKKYAWNGGGVSATSAPNIGYSDIYRYEYSTETNSSIPANLSSARYGSSGMPSRHKGYYLGGGTDQTGASNTSSVDKLEFDSETRSAGTAYPIASRYMGAGSGRSYGYAIGGCGPTPNISTYTTTYSQAYKYDFSADSWTPIGNSYPAGGQGTSAGGGGTPRGKIGKNSYIEGFTPVAIVRFNFETEVDATTGYNQPVSNILAAEFDSPLYGYFNGGYRDSRTWRLDFFTEQQNLFTNYPRILEAGSPLSSQHYGFLWGGYATPASTIVSSGTRMDFASESHVSINNWPTNLLGGKGLQDRTGNKGYMFGGGATFPGTSNIRRYEYFSDSATDLPAKTSFSDQMMWGFASQSNGYVGSGYNVASSNIRKFDFSTETASTTPSTLPSSIADAGPGSSALAGYLFGAYQAPTAAIRKFTFSDETASLLPDTLTFGGQDLDVVNG